MTKKILKISGAVVIVAIGLVAIINIYVYNYAIGYIYSIAQVPHAEVAIVLGANVSSTGVPSGVFKDRITTAVALYRAGKVSKILVTGDNSSIEHNEVNPIRTILMADGIPEPDIFLDHAGFDTYSSMYRAVKVFDVQNAIIVTQDFHLPRALYLAESLGIQATGVKADRGDYLWRNYIREILARPKAFLDVLIYRTPKYLGVQIPITGDGSQT